MHTHCNLPLVPFVRRQKHKCVFNMHTNLQMPHTGTHNTMRYWQGSYVTKGGFLAHVSLNVPSSFCSFPPPPFFLSSSFHPFTVVLRWSESASRKSPVPISQSSGVFGLNDFINLNNKYSTVHKTGKQKCVCGRVRWTVIIPTVDSRGRCRALCLSSAFHYNCRIDKDSSAHCDICGNAAA